MSEANSSTTHGHTSTLTGLHKTLDSPRPLINPLGKQSKGMFEQLVGFADTALMY